MTASRAAVEGPKPVLFIVCGGAIVLAAMYAASVLPAMRIMLGPIPLFLGPYAAIVASTEFLATMFLLWRAFALRSIRANLLACAYSFSLPLVLGNVITLPGVLFPRGTFEFTRPRNWRAAS